VRICHVIDYFHTDVGYQEFFLARDQARAGHDVTVVSSDHRQHTVAEPGPDEQLGLDELRDAGVTLVRLPGRQLGHDRAWIRGLGGAVAAARPEAAHVHGPFSPTTFRAVRAARRAGAGVLVDNHVHEAIAPGSTSPVNRLIYGGYRATAGAYLRRSVGAWVANGPHEADFLASRLGLPRRDVELVPLGFDPDVFGPDEDRRAAARTALGAAPDDAVIAVTGKLHPGKRPEAVAAACESLHAHRPTWLVLAGSIDPASRAAVLAAAPTLAAGGRVVERGLLGRRDLADLYRAADAVVFARLPSISIYEATGTGARVLVGRDQFAGWLAGQCPSIEPVDVQPDSLRDVEPADPATRTSRADQAAAAFAWPHVARRFTERYAALASEARHP
jgi:glycosyltransferase involved in cell wall biosynthesis